MIVDYRIYCSLYAVLFVSYLWGFPMVTAADGRYFKRYAITEAVLWLGLALTNFLDWLWS